KVCRSAKCVAKPEGTAGTGSSAPAPGTAPGWGSSSAGSPATTPAATQTSIGAVTPTFRPSLAVFGLYSWGGFGLGARLEWPILANVIKDFQWKNDLLAVGGLEYYTQSYSTFGSFRWNYVRIEAGAMWNFWVLENFA